MVLSAAIKVWPTRVRKLSGRWLRRRSKSCMMYTLPYFSTHLKNRQGSNGRFLSWFRATFSFSKISFKKLSTKKMKLSSQWIALGMNHQRVARTSKCKITRFDLYSISAQFDIHRYLIYILFRFIDQTWHIPNATRFSRQYSFSTKQRIFAKEKFTRNRIYPGNGIINLNFVDRLPEWSAIEFSRSLSRWT